MKNIFVTFLVMGFCLLGASLKAQSAKKVAGTWESVFRKAKTPCKFDWKLEFTLDGKALIKHGELTDKCKQSTSSFSTWTVEKKEAEFKGKNKKWDVIKLKGDYTVIMVIESFVGDFMKVSMELPDDDTTSIRTFIFKKTS